MAQSCPLPAERIDVGQLSGDQLGASVDVDDVGYRAAAGLPATEAPQAGSVRTYTRDGTTGVWAVDGTSVFDMNPQNADEFGAAVAIAGDILAVGAPGRQIGPIFSAGSVSIFQWTGTPASWQFRQRITRPGGDQPQSFFGASIDLIEVNGEWTLAVGCPGGTSPDLTINLPELAISGEVFLFSTTNPATWPTDAESVRRYAGIWEAVFSGSLSEFGAAVELDGDVLVVGAPAGNDVQAPSVIGTGAAYVYERVGGQWPEDSAVGSVRAVSAFQGLTVESRFGASVAVDGDVIGVGARDDALCCPPETSCQNPTVRGSVTILERGTHGWAFGQLLDEETCAPQSNFGSSISLLNGRLFIGAPAIGTVVVADRLENGTWVTAGSILEDEDGTDPIEIGFGSAIAAVAGLGDAAAGALVGWPQATIENGAEGILYDWVDPLPVDCDGDGDIDSCQIANDPSLDCDGNGELDSCQIAADPGLDCDGNGRLDSCDLIEFPNRFDCDGDGQHDCPQIAGNPSGEDCNGNGLLDSCESRSVEIVWVVDTSGSQFQKLAEICELIDAIELELANENAPDIADRVLVLSERLVLVQGDDSLPCASDLDGVYGRYGDDLTGLGFPANTPPPGLESWSAGAAVVARDYPWRTNHRIVVPLSDECGWNASAACDSDDIAAIVAARDLMRCVDVMAFPIQFSDPDGDFEEDVAAQMRILAGEFRDQPAPSDPLFGTGGRAFSVESGESLIVAFAEEVRRSLPVHDNDANGVLDACEFAELPGGSGLQDCNANWIDDAFEIRGDIGMSVASAAIPALPAECDVACPGDADEDRRVTFDDLLLVLSTWGPCSPPDPCPTDFDGNGTVEFLDLLQVLASWDWCFVPPACAADSRPGLAPPGSIAECIQKYVADPVKLQRCIEAMILAETP